MTASKHDQHEWQNDFWIPTKLLRFVTVLLIKKAAMYIKITQSIFDEL
jgi:hypothetical protein